MVTTRLYLDCRNSKGDNPAQIKIVLTKDRLRALISTGVSLSPSQWDASRQAVINHPCSRRVSAMLTERKLAVDNILYRMMTAGKLDGLSSTAIKKLVEANLFLVDKTPAKNTAPTFIDRFDAFVAAKSPGTQRVYAATRSRLAAFVGDRLPKLTFEEIDIRWLRAFDAFLVKTSPSRNARNIHFRNIRAVFNDALTEEIISCYPFRRFKLVPAANRKRALTVEKLRKVIHAEVEPHQRRYRDFFLLSFYLCGINVVDLCQLTKRSLVDGRIEYRRAKTHRLYSILVEPEVLDLLDAYRGRRWLFDFCDECSSYRSFYTHLCKNLREIGEALGIPGITTYWARHSWATIAASLDIPKETIAAALGHGGHSVTDIYIDFDQRKVDEANRRVIDWVLYSKR